MRIYKSLKAGATTGQPLDPAPKEKVRPGPLACLGFTR